MDFVDLLYRSIQFLAARFLFSLSNRPMGRLAGVVFHPDVHEVNLLDVSTKIKHSPCCECCYS